MTDDIGSLITNHSGVFSNSSTNSAIRVQTEPKNKHKDILNRMAFESNQVWNAANAETSEWCYIPIPEVGYIRNNISAFDLQK